MRTTFPRRQTRPRDARTASPRKLRVWAGFFRVPSPEERTAILAAQHGGCGVCGRPLGTMQWDDPNIADLDGTVVGYHCGTCDDLLAQFAYEPMYLARAAALLQGVAIERTAIRPKERLLPGSCLICGYLEASETWHATPGGEITATLCRYCDEGLEQCQGSARWLLAASTYIARRFPDGTAHRPRRRRSYA